ncbi:replication initiator protein A [Flavonifractor plautii]|nr:replication initiator protein A [Flavonifractor plautii]MCG4657518.1 replication initiator protein A [Flavonifractor plautii]
MNFDYYYGDESNQFAFYRIPRQLITGEAFKKLSTDAKLLYGLLLDRMGLSAKNGWYDDMGRVFIYYTLDEIQEDLNCGHEKAVRLLAELDTGKKGFGLIERVKQGQGRPTKIYVKRFTTRAIPPQPAAPQDIPRLPIFGSQDFGKAEVKSSEKQKSRLPVIGSADFRKSDTSYIESNQTDLSQLYPSMRWSPATAVCAPASWPGLKIFLLSSAIWTGTRPSFPWWTPTSSGRRSALWRRPAPIR